MKPEKQSENILNITRAKAKMIEYNIPEEYQQIKLETNPAKLFPLTIGLLGDYSYKINQPGITNTELEGLKSVLIFSSRFFDSFFQAKLDGELNDYVVLLGSATYYLCDLPGHSAVLAKQLMGKSLDLNATGLEHLLFGLLSSNTIIEYTGVYKSFIQKIVVAYYNFISSGDNEIAVLDTIGEFRNMIYEVGSARALLFIDIIAAVIKRKIENSCWNTLPEYSGLNMADWAATIKKEGFIKELWPAQHLMGTKGVLRGKSAVIQMPTSAGKTKTSEIIIRSAFLSERTSLAVIIAPYRALCHEIYNSLSVAFSYESIHVYEINDVLQMDISSEQLSGQKQILVVTPEKLFYVLSHNKEIALLSNLFIFDEGHQFDNGSRGITYELLLTTLLLLIPNKTQKILISAVIRNSEQISNWLNGEINVVSGKNIISVFKTIGFVSWIYQRGQIHYVKDDDKEKDDFYVPRVIEQKQLPNIGRERKIRYFPEKTDGQGISLFLGLKLVSNGSVAIFSGRKSSVSSILQKLIDINKRGYSLSVSNLTPSVNEVQSLGQLYAFNLGEECPVVKGAYLGVFAHHNNIPHGIRIAVEYAMHENLINFVVCTSTLAQGVNLPIRYLIISSFNQGGENIKTRDFHNLIGRAGRAGMYTEGSVIFADPKIYDGRDQYSNNWFWRKAQELLELEKSEPCISELPTIFRPLKSVDGTNEIPLNILKIIDSYFDTPNLIQELIEHILHNQDGDFTKENLEQQFLEKINLISAIENFMLSNWDELEALRGNEQYSNIVTKTLGYSLADDEMRTQLSGLFNAIENYIRKNITEPEKRKVYGRTHYGIKDAISIEEWFNNNIQIFVSVDTEEGLLDLVWPILKETFINKSILILSNIDNLIFVLKAWISGKSYKDLVDVFSENGIKSGKRRQRIDVDKTVDVCDNVFSFNGCLVLNALYEVAAQDIDANQDLMILLQKLQRRMKYGLDETSTIIYEIGFCDRVIAQDIKNTLKLSGNDRLQILFAIKANRDLASAIISRYPSYYKIKMDKLIN
jgi:superfamily II DNA/RNA helicase